MINRFLSIALGLAIVLGVSFTIYNYLNSPDTLDLRIGKSALEEMQTDEKWSEHIDNVTLLAPGEYKIETAGLESPDDAGRFAYNSALLFVMTGWELQSSRSAFTLYGYQDDVQIFEVVNDQWGRPTVTLLGPFEGNEYIPSFGSSIPSIEPDTTDIRAKSGSGLKAL